MKVIHFTNCCRNYVQEFVLRLDFEEGRLFDSNKYEQSHQHSIYSFFILIMPTNVCQVFWLDRIKAIYKSNNSNALTSWRSYPKTPALKWIASHETNQRILVDLNLNALSNRRSVNFSSTVAEFICEWMPKSLLFSFFLTIYN